MSWRDQVTLLPSGGWRDNVTPLSTLDLVNEIGVEEAEKLAQRMNAEAEARRPAPVATPEQTAAYQDFASTVTRQMGEAAAKAPPSPARRDRPYGTPLEKIGAPAAIEAIYESEKDLTPGDRKLRALARDRERDALSKAFDQYEAQARADIRATPIESDGLADRMRLSIKRSAMRLGAGGARWFAPMLKDVGADESSEKLLRRARDVEDYVARPIDGETTWEDVKRDKSLGSVLRFIAEQGAGSLVDMGVVASPAGAASYVGMSSGSMAQQRAENNGGPTADATADDFLKALPAATASSLLERIGLLGIFHAPAKTVVGRIIQSGGTEALTEALQGTVEYAGTNLGTNAGFKASEALDNALSGAVVGAGVGGGLRGTVEASGGVLRLAGSRLNGQSETAGLRADAESQAAVASPDDDASPLPTDAILSGRQAVASSEASRAASAMLQEAGLPSVDRRVRITMPDGSTRTGVVRDTFEREGADGGRGIKIDLDGGGKFEEYFDTIRDAGVSIAELGPADQAAAMQTELDRSITDPLGAALEPDTVADQPRKWQPPAGVERLGPVEEPTRSTVVTGDDARTALKRAIGRVESPSDTAKNPKSSAQGRYQFTDKTWMSTYRKVFGETGESRAEILAKKVDGNVQERLMDQLLADNAASLRRAGFDETAGNLYLAHFAGEAGARRLLSAAPNESAEALLGARVAKANPTVVPGKTASEVIAWANRKMGATAPADLDGGDQAPSSSTSFLDGPIGSPREEVKLPELRTDVSDAVDAYTTLYRVQGEKGASATPEWLADAYSQSDNAKAAGRWFMPDDAAQIAWYMKDAGEGARLTSVRVPTSDLEKYRVINIDRTEDGLDPQRYSRDAQSEFFLPKEIAAKAVDAARAAPSATVSVERNQAIIKGADADTLARVRSALPEGTRPIERADGALALPKRYESIVRDAIVGAAGAAPDIRGSQIDQEWVSFKPESGTLSIPRANMPQIAAEHRGAMVNFLNARGVSHEDATVPAASLKPTQAEFSEAKVAKARDFTGGDRAILISNDGHVLDGHHQWMAKREAGDDIRVIRLDAPIEKLLTTVADFPSATVDEGAGRATGLPEKTRYATIEMQGRSFPFSTFEEASKAYTQAIDQTGVGASQAPAAVIRDADGNVTANMAYNGRIFAADPEGRSITSEVLYRPAGEPAAAQAEVTGPPVADAIPAVEAQRPAATSEDFDVAPHRDQLARYIAETSGKIAPEPIAKALGIEPAQAERVLASIASAPNSGIFQTKGRPAQYRKILATPARTDRNGKRVAATYKEVLVRPAVPSRWQRVPRRAGPVNIVTFIRDRGGLRDDEGHALGKGGRDYNKRFPGLIRKNGMSADAALEAAQEAGYFTRDRSELTTDDLLQAVEQNQFRPEDQADRTVARQEPSEEDTAERRYNVNALADEIGLFLDDATVESAIDHMERGESVEIALQRALDEASAQTLYEGADEAGEQFYSGIAESIYEGEHAQQRDRGPEEGLAGFAPLEGDAGGLRAPDAQPDRDAEVARQEGEPAADRDDARGRVEAAAPAGLDLGEQVDPEASRRQRQETQLKSESPMRAAAEQDGTMGLGLFDASDQGDLLGKARSALQGALAALDAADPKSDRVIQDAGEKIGGARKDRWAERGLNLDDLAGMTEAEGFQFVTKDQVWPKPDYAAMVTAGATPEAAAASKLLRDTLAAKPKADSAKARTDFVTMMGHARDILADVKTIDDARSAQASLYERAGVESGYGIRQSPEQRAARQLLFSIFKGARADWTIGYREQNKIAKMIAEGFPTSRAEPWTRRFDVREVGRGQWAVVTKGVNRKFASADRFDGREAAVDAARELYANLNRNPDGSRATPARPQLDSINRSGEDVRQGRDVTPENFIQDFGFRGVEFGNWVAGDERQRSVNLAFEALHDLASIINVPPKAMSLGGRLAVAFGARGSGRAAAHYEPGKLVINLTKMSGAGSLAHEWAHAVDHYFGELDGDAGSRGAPKGASGWYDRTESRVSALANLRPQMAAAFDRVMATIFKRDLTRAEAVRVSELRIEKLQAGIDRQREQVERARANQSEDRRANATASKFIRESEQWINLQERALLAAGERLADLKDEAKPASLGSVTSSFYHNAAALSGKAGSRGYWARPTEMFARSFEAYVFDRIANRGNVSEYLVQGVEPERYASEEYAGNPYPTGEERAAINAAYDALFEEMRVRDAEGGPELYSLTDPVAELTGNEITGSTRAERSLSARSWYYRHLRGTTATTADGREVRFTKKGGTKSIFGKGDRLLSAVPAIRDIVERGVVIHESASNRPDITRVQWIAATVRVGGEDLRLAVMVREHREGWLQYDFTDAVFPETQPEAGGAASRTLGNPAKEGVPGNDLNLILADDVRKGDAETAEISAALDDLRNRLRDLGVSEKVAVSVVERFQSPRIAGVYRDRMITVALNSDQAALDTVNHEVIHAQKALGLFRDAEWRALERAALADRRLMASIERRYPNLDRAAQIEEAIADRFAKWAAGQRERGFVQTAFDRLRNFIRALGQALRGQGFTTADAVMRAIDAGRVGRRPEGAAQRSGAKESVSRPIDSQKKLESPAFAKWFAGSKVTFNDGKTPLPMFHGTNADEDFSFFDTYASNYGLMGMGAYFTADPSIASSYTRKGRGNSPRIFPVYLSIKNPLDMDAVADPAKWMAQFEGVDAYHEGGDTNEDWYRAAEDLISDDGVSKWEGAEIMQDGLRNMGFDGITHMGGGRVNTDGPRHRVFVAFEPEQIKSAISNSGTYDPENPDIRFSVTEDLFGGLPGRVNATIDAMRREGPFGARATEAWERFRTGMQDRFLPLMNVQQAAEKDLGIRLDETMNPYLGEELMTGRMGARMDTLADETVLPLFGAIVEEDVSIDELETYLYARHAPERNKRISEINPLFGEGEGSGMTDIEAAAIMNRIKAAGKMEAMERLAARVDKMLNDALQTRIDAGLLSTGDAAIWREHYKHYVPLRGRGGNLEGDAEGAPSRLSSQSGISVKGKESRRAYGRRSKADSILSYSILAAQEAIHRAEKNRVARQFYELAKAYPDPDFWRVDKVERRPFMGADGQVGYRMESRISAEDADYTVSLKVDGIEHRVTMNRDNAEAVKLAVAMRNLTAEKLNWFVQKAGAINRFLSSVNTSYNPEFVITNAFRDMQTAGVNLNRFDLKGLVRGVAKDYRKALVGSIRGAFGSERGDWGKWYREFADEGGRVYFNKFEDLDAIKKRVEADFKMVKDKAEGRITLRRALKSTFEFVDNANTGVENAIRLAAYKNARERGLSKAQAASLAKNLTVNFNRRGQYGAFINSFYMFYNASVQGTAAMLGAMKSPRVRKILAGAIMTGAALELLNAMLSDDDDDGQAYWDKISAFDKSRNLIIMIPGRNGEHIKIPLPYGYNVFYGMGRGLAEIARRGGVGWQASLADMFKTAVDAFNPVGGAESLLNTIAPTIVDPIVDLWGDNRDFADRPILPDANPFEPTPPDAQRYFGSVSPYLREITDLLTAASGGDEVLPGAIDVSPETLEYMMGVTLGAAGSTASRTLGFVQKLFSNDPDVEMSTNDWPMARKVVGSVPPWYDKSAFYDRIQQVELAYDRAKQYAAGENREGFDALVEAERSTLSMVGAAKAARTQLRLIRKARAQSEHEHDMGRLDDSDFKARKALLKEREDALVTAFNTRWNEIMRPETGE